MINWFLYAWWQGILDSWGSKLPTKLNYLIGLSVLLYLYCVVSVLLYLYCVVSVLLYLYCVVSVLNCSPWRSSKARFPLTYFAAAGEKFWQRNHFFKFIRRWTNLFSCYSFSTSVWPFVDGAKEQQMNFFGGEIFRQRRQNTWVENGLKNHLLLIQC